MTDQSKVQQTVPDEANDSAHVQDEAASSQDAQSNAPKGTVLTAPLKVDRSRPAKLLGFTLPQPLSQVVYNVQDAGNSYRFSALKALPSGVVNNSSNMIGATQLVGEALYFKSSGVNQFIKEEHKGTWKAFVYPPINVVEGVFKKSAFRIDWKEMLNPARMWQEVKNFGNLEEAARLDLAHSGKLSNRWSARSGFAGMTSMAISTALPEEKDTPEKTEQMATMARENPLMYGAMRLGKGLAFPVLTPIRLVQQVLDPKGEHHLGDGKREFAGIGMTLTGFFSVLAGFRQPRQRGNIMKYDFNQWQALGGAITTYAGSQLLTGIDNQQGWTNYGGTQFFRLLVLPQSIRERFPNKEGWGDPNAKYYFGAQGVFQTKNLVAVTIGGAEKLPDGTIVDQTAARKAGYEKARSAREQRSAQHDSNKTLRSEAGATTADAPATTVASVTQLEAAMPERVKEHALQKESGAQAAIA